MLEWFPSPYKERLICKASSSCCLACKRSPAFALILPRSTSAAITSGLSVFPCFCRNSSNDCSNSCRVAVNSPVVASERSRASASTSPCVGLSSVTLHVTRVMLPKTGACEWDWVVGCVNASDSEAGKMFTCNSGCSSSSAMRVALMICPPADLHCKRASGPPSSIAMLLAHWRMAAKTLAALSSCQCCNSRYVSCAVPRHVRISTASSRILGRASHISAASFWGAKSLMVLNFATICSVCAGSTMARSQRTNMAWYLCFGQSTSLKLDLC